MARATVLQWMVGRAVSEGATTTRGRVAAMLGVDVSAVHARAAAENWKCIDWRSGRLQALQREIIAVNAALRDLDEAPWPPGAAEGSGTAAGIDRVDGTDPMDRGLDGAAFVASAMPARDAAVAALPVVDGSDPVAVLAGASAFVARQVAALIARAERTGGRLDKKQIDGLSAFARMMERWETLAKERAKDDDETEAADLADLTRRVNDRIVELAALEARRLVAAGYRPGEDD